MIRNIIQGPGFCAVTEDGVLVEYIQEDPSRQCGDILTGRIDRLMPGLNCAFVDIGRKKSGFLPLDEQSSSFTGSKPRSGEKIILQIKKEETGSKGAFLTRDVTFPGNTVILMPLNRFIGVSSRTEDEEIRDRLKTLGKEIAAGRFGLVLRKAAETADAETIRGEAESLYEQWIALTETAASIGKTGTVLYSGSAAEQLKQDYASRGIDMVQETETLSPDIRKQLTTATERKLTLPGGGNIVVDRCEAMTVIDVNTASFSGHGMKEQTILETNLEACRMIARQVRLRNISGIILIDFINMDSDTDRIRVQQELTECFSCDRIKTVIHGWTSLGLLEMTRKRTRPALYEELFKVCPFCGGTGYRLREQKE